MENWHAMLEAKFVFNFDLRQYFDSPFFLCLKKILVKFCLKTFIQFHAYLLRFSSSGATILFDKTKLSFLITSLIFPIMFPWRRKIIFSGAAQGPGSPTQKIIEKRRRSENCRAT